MWQNPQIAILSPCIRWRHLPLQLAMKINIVLHYWIGFIGMHVLLTARDRRAFLPGGDLLRDAGDRGGRAGDSPARRPQRVPPRLLPAAADLLLLPGLQDGLVEYIFLSAATLA
jgi:hypothetical protein